MRRNKNILTCAKIAIDKILLKNIIGKYKQKNNLNFSKNLEGQLIFGKSFFKKMEEEFLTRLINEDDDLEDDNWDDDADANGDGDDDVATDDEEGESGDE